MAPACLLIVVFVAVANAGYVWVDDDENDAPQGYKRMYVPPIMQPPPGFGPPLPQPPPLYVRDFSQPLPDFTSHFGSFHNIPSAAEIKTIKSDPGRIFNGAALRSKSKIHKDEDGKSTRTGGTTIVINEDGDVKETKVGKNPPNIEDPIVFPSPQILEFPKIPEPVHFKPYEFKPLKFKPFKFKHFEPITFKPFEPITFKPIDLDYTPEEGEKYVAVSHSSHSESSNVNGVVSESGGSNVKVNDNGNTDQEKVEFRNDPKNSQDNESNE